VAGSCEYGDESSGPGATELVPIYTTDACLQASAFTHVSKSHKHKPHVVVY
jgi:hypothetical protein